MLLSLVMNSVVSLTLTSGSVICYTFFLESYLFRFGFCRGYFLAFRGELSTKSTLATGTATATGTGSNSIKNEKTSSSLSGQPVSASLPRRFPLPSPSEPRLSS